MKLTNSHINYPSSLQSYIDKVTVEEMFQRFGDPNTDDYDYVAWNFEMPSGNILPIYARQPCDDECPWDYTFTMKVGGDSKEEADILRGFIESEFGVGN